MKVLRKAEWIVLPFYDIYPKFKEKQKKIKFCEPKWILKYLMVIQRWKKGGNMLA